MNRKSSQWLALATVFLAALFPLSAASQVPGITLSPGTEISTDSPRVPHFETFLAINPRDPQNLLATSLFIKDGHMGSVVYASFDGGKTWKQARATGPGNAVFRGGDPVVYFDPQGTAFFASIQGAPSGFLLSRSTDGGLTWGPPVTIPGGPHDREYLAFDHTGGKFNGRIYAGGKLSAFATDGAGLGAIHVVYSTDGGRTFSTGHGIVRSQGGEEPWAIAEMLVAPDGTLVVPFQAFAVPAAGSSPATRLCGHMWVLISRDGGNTFLPARQGPAYCWATGFDTYKSAVAPQATMDLSQGPHRGRLYLVYTDFDGKQYDVKVAHSDDLGKTWSSPATVNDNTSADSPANPAIAVNKDGIVGVVWNDRRDDPPSSCFRLYFALSTDGGDSFLPNLRASDQPACPLAAANWTQEAYSRKWQRLPEIFLTGVPERWPNGGDTQGLVAGPDGDFRSAYISSDGPSGVTQIWYKEFRVDEGALPPSATAAPRQDLSQQLTLDVGAPQIDFATDTLSLRVRIVNPLTVPVTGPFTLVLSDLETFLKDLEAVNADNGLPGKGAFWNVPALAGNRLPPGQKSGWRDLQWKFSGGRPPTPGEYLGFRFRILGGKKNGVR